MLQPMLDSQQNSPLGLSPDEDDGDWRKDVPRLPPFDPHLPLLLEWLDPLQKDLEVSFKRLDLIWDCPMIKKVSLIDDCNVVQSGWRYIHCQVHPQMFLLFNATKALNHVRRRPKRDVRLCTANIPESYIMSYRDLKYQNNLKNKELEKKKGNMSNHINLLQDRMSESMSARGNRKMYVWSVCAKVVCFAFTLTIFPLIKL
jgi:hypothetical protein